VLPQWREGSPGGRRDILLRGSSLVGRLLTCEGILVRGWGLGCEGDMGVSIDKSD
jgi:hypothetical protein